MRVITCALTFLTAFGACGGTPQRVTTYSLGPDGKFVRDTAREEVVVDRQALISSGVGYTFDCTNDSTIFGGELKAYYYSDRPISGSSPCMGFGAGANNIMAISTPEWNWPGTSEALSVQDIGSFEVKLADHGNTDHGRNTWFRNDQGGGGVPQMQLNGTTSQEASREGGPGWFWWANLSLSDPPHSVYVNRYCGSPGDVQC